MLVRMKFGSVDTDGIKKSTVLELTLPEFYELYHELKKGKNLIDMMG